MSLLRLPNGDDHPEAATKHLDDAQLLLSVAHADGAAYLAGCVVECALKSVIIVEHSLHMTLKGAGAEARQFRHSLDRLSSEALRLAALAGARTARYVPRMTTGHSLYDAASGWKESLRYRGRGAISPTDAGSWLAEARGVYQSTIVPMRLDGVL